MLSVGNNMKSSMTDAAKQVIDGSNKSHHHWMDAVLETMVVVIVSLTGQWHYRDHSGYELS